MKHKFQIGAAVQKKSRKRGEHLTLAELQALQGAFAEIRDKVDKCDVRKMLQELSSRWGLTEKSLKKYWEKPELLAQAKERKQSTWFSSLDDRIRVFLYIGRLLNWKIGPLIAVASRYMIATKTRYL